MPIWRKTVCIAEETIYWMLRIPRIKSLPFHSCLDVKRTETGLFVSQLADGIMGMSAHESTLPKKLHEQWQD